MSSVLDRPEAKEAMKKMLIRVGERIERGESPPMRTVPTEKSDFPKILCLDHNKWIDLARAHYGRDDGKPFQQALESVRAAIEEKQIDRSNPRDESVLKEELGRSVIRLCLGRHCGPFPRHRIVRWGIFSALGEEPPWGDNLFAQAMYEPELAVYFLAYAADREAIRRSRELDKKAAGVAVKAREEAGAARRLAELAAVFESRTIAAMLAEILEVEGIDKAAFQKWLSDSLVRFAEATPSIDVSGGLLLTWDKNPHHKTHANDLKDFAF